MAPHKLIFYQYVIGGALSAISIPLYALLIRKGLQNKTKTVRLTPVFCCYLCNWWAYMTATLAYNTYMILRFHKHHSTVSIFAWGSAVQLTLMTSPITVFFVVLERNLVFIAPFQQNTVRWWLIRVEIVVLTICYFVFIFELFYVVQEWNFHTGCRAFGCLMSRKGGSLHLTIKILMGVVNIANMCVFVLALQGMNRTTSQRRTNRLALIVILMELLWNILPLIVTNALILTLNMNVAAHVGPYVQTLTSVDGFISSVIYTMALRPMSTPPNGSFECEQKPLGRQHNRRGSSRASYPTDNMASIKQHKESLQVALM